MGAFSIENARVFDGERLSEPRSVHVVDGLITEEPGADSETVDAAGAVLLPGLIDAHVHISDPEQARTLAHWGVTTALDMGAKDPGVIEATRGVAGGSDVRSAGFPAGPPHGTHIARLGFPESVGISGPDEAEAWVAARVAEGSDYIKVLLEPEIPQQPKPLQPETAAAIVRAAHAAGKKVIAHTTTGRTAEIAVASGVDAFTHTPLGDVLGVEFAREVASRGVIAIPTLSMMNAMATDWPFPVRPPGVSFENCLQSLRNLRAAGVTIVAGTDANTNPATPASPPPGESLHTEFELMGQAGVTPVESLRAATSTAADFFGLADRGRIQPGLRADLVLVDGDPTVDISATRAIRGVWIAGERVR
ncbi:amidohydrolase [Glaciibacter flavus]|uniref:Amidohydrolase n=1 Tax=Orlajensenia flava TaxID=2565934 RepID=A0A4S4FRZ9_9MICO|nr:amidohydrolase family protein [Glaciibacter flavus]THG32475.1 amidohydrolase [Glaciibacter flavus]